MLQVQQDIQVKQLENTDALARITKKHEEISKKQEKITNQQEKNTQAIVNLTENVSNAKSKAFPVVATTICADTLHIVSQRHEDRLTRLYGYQMTSDGDRLNIMKGVNDIKRRLTVIEERLNAGQKP